MSLSSRGVTVTLTRLCFEYSNSDLGGGDESSKNAEAASQIFSFDRSTDLTDCPAREQRMSGYDFRDACEAGDLDKVKGKFYSARSLIVVRLNSGLIKSVDINETDEYGYTGLHLAAEHGHLKVVEELMVGSTVVE